MLIANLALLLSHPPLPGLVSSITGEEFMQHYFLFVFPIFFVCLWLFICAVISYTGGWATLSQFFRTQFPFPGAKWQLQRGQMRFGVGYNGCLTVGSSPVGLYLAVLSLFRFMHPPLLVPWHEIKVKRSTHWLLGEYVTLTLGREAAIPLRIRGKLAAGLRDGAGGSWPIEET